jgi:peptidoglycan/LPS O-acetylase OafA/YrhL
MLLVIAKGSVWTVNHDYWIDLAICPAIALLLAALAAGQADLLARVLTTRPLRALGSCSYSLYLIHVPIVLVVSRRLGAPYAAPGVSTFWVTLAVGASLSVLAARVFARFFEAPFQGHRETATTRALLPSAQPRSELGLAAP